MKWKAAKLFATASRGSVEKTVQCLPLCPLVSDVCECREYGGTLKDEDINTVTNTVFSPVSCLNVAALMFPLAFLDTPSCALWPSLTSFYVPFGLP